MPIASLTKLTKLMMALVVRDAHQNMAEQLSVTSADIDRPKYSSSRLRVGTGLSRSQMLHSALMGSENRAASALGRNYPDGPRSFVAAMNAKARFLGMRSTRYVEPTGLSRANVASPAVMVFVDAQGKFSRAADANSVRAWLPTFYPWSARLPG